MSWNLGPDEERNVYVLLDEGSIAMFCLDGLYVVVFDNGDTKIRRTSRVSVRAALLAVVEEAFKE